MNEQPKEIEERLVEQIIKTHMNMRRWTKRILVIGTVAATLLLVEALRSVVAGRYEVAILNLFLAAFNIANAYTAYRRVV